MIYADYKSRAESRLSRADRIAHAISEAIAHAVFFLYLLGFLAVIAGALR